MGDGYDDKDRVRRVMLTCPDISSLNCLQCSEVCPFYDLRTVRSWCHLDTCTYRTEMVARIPRVKCPVHGVWTVQVHEASPSSPRFTHGFEEMGIRVWRQLKIRLVTLGLQ